MTNIFVYFWNRSSHWPCLLNNRPSHWCKIPYLISSNKNKYTKYHNQWSSVIHSKYLITRKIRENNIKDLCESNQVKKYWFLEKRKQLWPFFALKFHCAYNRFFQPNQSIISSGIRQKCQQHLHTYCLPCHNSYLSSIMEIRCFLHILHCLPKMWSYKLYVITKQSTMDLKLFAGAMGIGILKGSLDEPGSLSKSGMFLMVVVELGISRLKFIFVLLPIWIANNNISLLRK